MRYRELIEKLQERYEIQPLVEGDSPSIMDIRLLEGKEQQWNEYVLYVGSCAGLKNPPDRPIMLLSVGDPPPLPEGSSCARIKFDDMCSLFNAAKDLICRDLREEAVFFDLAQMAADEKNVQYIINAAAALLGNALILVDAGQKVLAYSTNYEIVDPLWVQNVARGYCSFEFVQIVRSSRDMKQWSKHGNETQFITLPGDRQPKLVARVTHKNHVIGALVMIVHHKPVGNLHLRLLPLIGKLLFAVLNRDSSFEQSYHSPYGAILYNLLDDEEISDTLEYINSTGLRFPPEMRVVVARFVHIPENRYLKHTFSMQLERIFPEGHSVVYKSYIGILVPSVSDTQREELIMLAKNENVDIGISWPFSDIVEFKRHFNQAVSAIKLAHLFGLTNQVLDYSDFHYYDLLSNYAGRIPLEHFCHPALRVLREYDKANNTDLYTTLRAYLECNLNQCAAAKALFIHRNSLIYRIKRIKQVTGLDLNDHKVVRSLIDSFRIDTFLNSTTKIPLQGSRKTF
ncbi:helix-turn-helix domain-containing protein [Moorellaceae bacterium AZ2]